MTDEKIFTVLEAGAMGWGIAYMVSSYQKARVRI